MARINIEDSLFTDVRFQKVCEKIGKTQAIGFWVLIAQQAQKYWGAGKLPIPNDILGFLEIPKEFFDFGMLKKDDENGYFLRGSEDCFDWYLSKRENGKRGGRPKNNNLHKPNLTENEPSKKLLEPSYSYSCSISYSNSCSKEESSKLNNSVNNFPEKVFSGAEDLRGSSSSEKIVQYSEKNAGNMPRIENNADVNAKARVKDENALNRRKTSNTNVSKKIETKSEELEVFRRCRDAYISSYEMRYGLKPVWAAKENNLLKKFVKTVGETEALWLCQNYLSYNEPYHVRCKHPLGLLIGQVSQVRIELRDARRMLDARQAQKQINKIADENLKEVEQKNEFEKFASAVLQ